MQPSAAAVDRLPSAIGPSIAQAPPARTPAPDSRYRAPTQRSTRVSPLNSPAAKDVPNCSPPLGDVQTTPTPSGRRIIPSGAQRGSSPSQSWSIASSHTSVPPR